MEPERKIEKLLRAFAKKRRDDAGDSFKLHPATRRLLQGEVARRAAKPEAENLFARLFARLRPGLIYATCFAVVVFMGAALLLPSFSKAKSRSQLGSALNNLKQIGLATKEFAEENNQQLPASLAEIQRVTGTNLLLDPVSGKPFVYVAGGRSVDSLRADSVLAYSPEAARNRAVLYADGHVETVSPTRFSEITNRGLIQLAQADTSVRRELAAAPAVANDYEAKAADLPAATLAVNGNNFEAPKMEADNTDRKKSTTVLFDSELASNGATKAKALAASPATVAANRETATPSALKSDVAAAQTEALSGKIVARDSLVSNAASATQQFARQAGNNSGAQNVFKNAAASAKITPVLANFQFQQNGSAVAVVDEDGSVYNGYLVAAKDAKLQNASVESNRAPAGPGQSAPKLAKDFELKKNQESPAENYFFRVAGTNRSLRQNVVFTGNVLTFSNVVSVSSSFVGGVGWAGSGGGNNAAQVLDKSQVQQSFFSNSRISGTAVVNNTNAIEINALPVAP